MDLPELTQKYFEVEKKIVEAVETRTSIVNKINEEKKVIDKVIQDLYSEQREIYELIKVKNVWYMEFSDIPLNHI